MEAEAPPSFPLPDPLLHLATTLHARRHITSVSFFIQSLISGWPGRKGAVQGSTRCWLAPPTGLHARLGLGEQGRLQASSLRRQCSYMRRTWSRSKRLVAMVPSR